MRIVGLRLHRVAVPLKKVVKHASLERSVERQPGGACRAGRWSRRLRGGRAAVRTSPGRRSSTTFATLSAHDRRAQIGGPATSARSFERLEALPIPETESDPRGMAGNAARPLPWNWPSSMRSAADFGESAGRAVELANRRRDSTPRRTRGLSGTAARSRPSPPTASGSTAVKMRLYGFHQVKVKVGTQGQDDPRRLGRCGGFSAADGHPARRQRGVGRRRARRAHRAAAAVRPSVLEQPVPHAEVDALAELRPRLGVPVMLDESLCGCPTRCGRRPSRTADIFNVRLSKCGGIVPSLRIIALAQRSGLGCSSAATRARRRSSRRPDEHFASRVAGPPLRRRLLRPPHPGRQPDAPGPHLPLRRLGTAAGRPGAGRPGGSRGPRGDDRREPGDPV